MNIDRKLIDTHTGNILDNETIISSMKKMQLNCQYKGLNCFEVEIPFFRSDILH